MKKIVLRLLIIYKKYFSFGYNCRFTPTCSEYSYQAIEKYGVLKGRIMSIKRVLKCNPLNKGGVDLLK